MIAHPSGWLEKRLFPESWTPNCITLIGQIPQLLLILVVFSQIGMSLTRIQFIESSYFFWMAAAVQWFSQNDIMDGIRARRQQSGTPLGRIVDEALDMT